MKLNLTLLLLLILITNNLAFPQDMSDGFQMLEVKQYEQAEVFFKDIISEYPDNKTASICLGRATGLRGKAVQANKHFQNLLKEYPEDQEIMINLAESLLWNGEYEKAVKTYQKIKLRDAKSIAVLLGLSNALAANANYAAAYVEIKQLSKQYPDNKQITSSSKSITLAYAHQLKKTNRLLESQSILTEYLKQYPEDAEGLKSSAYIHMAMEDVINSKKKFETLLRLNTQNDQALLGLASLSLFAKEIEKAITYCLHPDVMQASEVDKGAKTQQLDILFGAYLESGKLVLATETLEDLKAYISSDAYLEKLIYVQLQKENYTVIPEHLDNIQDNDSKKRLSLSYYMHQRDYKSARQVLDQMSPSQMKDKQVKHVAERLMAEEASYISGVVDHNQDNGGYAASVLSISYKGAKTATIQPVLRILAYQLNQGEKNSSFRRQQVSAGINIRLGKKHTTGLSFGYQIEKYNSFNNENQLTYRLAHEWTINNRQFIKVNLESSQLPMNYELIKEQINQDIIQLEHHIISKSNLGSYTSMTFNKLSDDNLGFNFVNSLYYNISSLPLVQIGLNTNIQSYKQSAEDYFSPELLYSLSSFAKVSNEYIQDKKWAYNAMISLGKQSSPTKSMSQITYNVSSEIGYHITQNTKFAAYGEFSKSDRANHIDYMRYQVGIRLSHSMTK